MKTMSARKAKNAFGLMIDTARAEPVLIEKHGRGVVMVIAVEEYERLHRSGNAAPTQSESADSQRGRTEAKHANSPFLPGPQGGQAIAR
jgi:prevent-host-death family protein